MLTVSLIISATVIIFLSGITAILLREYNCRNVLSRAFKKIADTDWEVSVTEIVEAVAELEKMNFQYGGIWEERADKIICLIFRKSCTPQKTFESLRVTYLNALKLTLSSTCQQ